MRSGALRWEPPMCAERSLFDERRAESPASVLAANGGNSWPGGCPACGTAAADKASGVAAPALRTATTALPAIRQ